MKIEGTLYVIDKNRQIIDKSSTVQFYNTHAFNKQLYFFFFYFSTAFLFWKCDKTIDINI